METLLHVLFLIAQMNVWATTLPGAAALRRLQGKLATRPVPGCVRLDDMTKDQGQGTGVKTCPSGGLSNLAVWTSIVGILRHSVTHPGQAIF